MSVIDSIIKANKEGRKVVWPGTEKSDIELEQCSRCHEMHEYLSWSGYCDTCEDDMNSRTYDEEYIEAAQPVSPYKRK